MLPKCRSCLTCYCTDETSAGGSRRDFMYAGEESVGRSDRTQGTEGVRGAGSRERDEIGSSTLSVLLI